MALVVIAVLSIPWMWLTKPLYLKYKHKQKGKAKAPPPETVRSSSEILPTDSKEETDADFEAAARRMSVVSMARRASRQVSRVASRSDTLEQQPTGHHDEEEFDFGEV